MKPAMIVHGGAGPWPDAEDSARGQALVDALHTGWRILEAGGTALEAVEKATNILEDFPLFDAGIGSFLNQMGEVEMDALIVDGAALDFGAVAGVKHVRYPISLARRIMTDTPHCFLAGSGADLLARQLGFPVMSNLFFVTEAEFHRFHEKQHAAPRPQGTGTVGAVALDTRGNLAAATSTGGVPDKMPGRVGDSPVFGAGGYADNRYGAASATGVGENILRVLLSKYAVDAIAGGMNARAAAAASIDHINSRFQDSQAGLIVVDRDGQVGAAHSTLKISIAWMDADGQPRVSMQGGVGVR
ncbi:MAG: isoaspartyl peptidase/L-asparaginase [Anaerolineae bacterium]|jgi:beta-aspartyl-peptidase (threonine type)|nr:isoaspartyl peptidase/L-asparaginase [Anaerolineae bacterium]